MVVLSPREVCTEVSDGTSFRSARLLDRIDDKLICPMPRKAASVSFTTGEFMKPIWQRRSAPPSLDCEASREISEIFRSKSSCTNAANFGCSPPFFSGSPPSRAGNPIVRDAEFSHERQFPLPAASVDGNAIIIKQEDEENLSNRPTPPVPAPIVQTKSVVSTPPTYRATPSVRVEGFECPARAFECETRRQVPVIA